jgi:hypothetical protein
MAQYQYTDFVQRAKADAFDRLWGVGWPTPFSGIYRCEACGREILSTAAQPLPQQNHHNHAVPQAILWRLIVATTHP